MTKLSNATIALFLGGIVAAGVVNGTACDDDDDLIGSGSGGSTGSGGSAATGSGGSAATGSGGSAATGDAGAATTVTVSLTSAMEVPVNASTATASATVTLDPSGMVTVMGTFTGLTTAATAAHIHGPADPGTNAPVIVPLTVPSATSGTVMGSGMLTAPQMASFASGQTYLNIHSSTYPMGEIRGQITP